MNEKKYEFLTQMIKNNTESTPIKVMTCLLENMSDEDCTSRVPYSELEKWVGIGKRNISVHIRRFIEDGVIERRKDGRFNIYKINIQ